MMNILIVEDEELIRKSIVLTIDWEALGCRVAGEAANGVEALEAVEKLSPDLIITDLKMPLMDGIKLLKTLREQENQIPVIILTAYDTFQYVQSALRLGAVDYLLKPFHDGELETAVERVRKRIAPIPNTRVIEEIPGIKPYYDSKYVMEVLRYIAGNYHKPDVTISSMAKDFGVSEGHLSHIFKKETGHTLSRYLTTYRIYKAKVLLQNCRIKVFEAAEQVGYKDIAHFSGTFKKIVGMSPSEYQNTCQNTK